MKVLKFGGTSVGTAERIKHVGELAATSACNIVVLSAMSGTTNTLVEIGEYLYKGNIPGAQETINALETKYAAVISELLDTPDGRNRASVAIGRSMAILRSFCRGEFGGEDAEKEILAQGELMSTALMEAHLLERGLRPVMLPALDFMRTLENGEPDMEYITDRIRRLIELEPDAALYITQGYICRNSQGKIDNLKRGGSDYTASLIGAAVDAEEIQIWTDIDGMQIGRASCRERV